MMTTDELGLAILALSRLPARERARQAPLLFAAARETLAAARGAALAEAVAGGETVAGMAREFGSPRSKLDDALAAHRKAAAGRGT
jgi:hypothetical protein